MTFDGTNVDIDELVAFGKGAHERAKDTLEAANAVAGVHLGSDMLGLFSLAFLDSARHDQGEVAANARAVAAALSADGAVATANAEDFDSTNTAQASRFTDKELS